METIFFKNKEEFKNIRERLVETSHKLGMSVTDFKKPSEQSTKRRKRNQELQKRKWLKRI